MGLIISRFRRKKTTTEELEKLDRDIKTLEQRGQWTALQHRKIISVMTGYSVGIYVMFAIIYYFMYTGKSVSWSQSLAYATPFLILPALVLVLRSGISWYYDRKLSKDRGRLFRMREQKKKLLEDVMNTETYKVAKEILEKYGDPDTRQKELRPFVPTTNVPGNTTPTATPGQLRQRQLALQSTPNQSPITPCNNNNLSVASSVLRTPLRPEQLPHPLVPSQLSAFDRVLNFFLNDGPNKRFALICNACSSHNGMVLEELYDYTSFKCAYCGRLNPSRKQRPRAPPLALTPARDKPQLTNVSDPVTRIDSSESDSEQENNSAGTESDAAVKPLLQKSAEEKKVD